MFRPIGGFVTGFGEVISDLRQVEQQLVRQLEGVRTAIASLEMNGASTPSTKRAPGGAVEASAGKPARRRRGMPAAARRAVSLRMKKYWAARRKASKAA